MIRTLVMSFYNLCAIMNSNIKVTLGVDGWIILGWIFRRWDVGYMDWIGLAQDRDRWRTLVSAVMNLRLP